MPCRDLGLRRHDRYLLALRVKWLMMIQDLTWRVSLAPPLFNDVSISSISVIGSRYRKLGSGRHVIRAAISSGGISEGAVYQKGPYIRRGRISEGAVYQKGPYIRRGRISEGAVY
jgi:hypothetical protein